VLKKINRFEKKRDFEEVMDKGILIQSPFFGLKIIKNGDEKKFGFVISKKISKKAVVRNKIKRLLAEVVRKILIDSEWKGKAIFLVKKRALEADTNDLEKEIRRVLNDEKSYS
jgi:ribonuclease P protein component